MSQVKEVEDGDCPLLTSGYLAHNLPAKEGTDVPRRERERQQNSCLLVVDACFLLLVFGGFPCIAQRSFLQATREAGFWWPICNIPYFSISKKRTWREANGALILGPKRGQEQREAPSSPKNRRVIGHVSTYVRGKARRLSHLGTQVRHFLGSCKP